MLLTVAWSASLFIGKCNLNNQGVSIDGSGKGKFSMTKQVCIKSILAMYLLSLKHLETM